ncbi:MULTISPECIES: ZIP family metal transporter [Rhodococcus]|uniref:ZIP family metal transporter n=1 Tax=Rhodococcus TaxID=1827 RepID=UPI002952AD5E|nr:MULTISPECIES: ZIP family metal transporter [Rhodococcus]MDV7246574.1 ZIP family metal transporter [Rhodococcus oxybenzonivorans]MDV7337586.1 ZIP family metal transporter [Rhodococcus oxybenzonivorans]MDV8031404.1 ZIP family metal transporter [Rhodococcus sp. IEGM 27]
MRGVGVVAIIVAALAALAMLAGQSLPERTGPPIENIAVERTVLEPGQISLTLRNVGPDPVTVAQVFVNDAFVDLDGAEEPLGRLDSETITLDYPWIAGQPYLISMLTNTGLVIEHEIPAAVDTPQPGAAFFGTMALLGLYVGIIPVLLGMLLLPVMRRASAEVVKFVLAVTVGLLVFLAFDGASEGLELAAASGGAFGGTTLVVLGAAAAILTLMGIDRYLRARRARADAAGASELRLSVMIAAGIGLHNLGEGLAIGSAYAVGELALGAFLVIGFTLHNTTEGLAIIAPLTRRRTSVPTLLGLGMLAGAPAILGAILGAGVSNTEVSALLLGVGVGAIIQVIIQIVPSLRSDDRTGSGPWVLVGIGTGMLLMFVTALAVPA